MVVGISRYPYMLAVVMSRRKMRQNGQTGKMGSLLAGAVKSFTSVLDAGSYKDW